MADDHRRQLHPRAVRRVHQPGERGQLVRVGRRRIAVEPQHVPGGLERVRDQPADDHRQGPQPVRQRRGDPEVPAAAAQTPHQIGIRLVGHLQHLAVRGHQLDGDQVVAGQALGGHQPAQPAAQRVAGDPGGRDRAPGDGQAVRPGRLVDVAPARAALCPGRRRRRVDVDPAHPGQVDHQAALGHRPAGDVVPAAAHRDLQPGLTGVAHRGRDVLGVRAAGDQRGPAVDQPVVHPAGGVVPLVAGCQERAGERRGERRSSCHGSTSGNGDAVRPILSETRAHRHASVAASASTSSRRPPRPPATRVGPCRDVAAAAEPRGRGRNQAAADREVERLVQPVREHCEISAGKNSRPLRCAPGRCSGAAATGLEARASGCTRGTTRQQADRRQLRDPVRVRRGHAGATSPCCMVPGSDAARPRIISEKNTPIESTRAGPA